MNDDELEAFVKIADENGDISKNDIIIQVKRETLKVNSHRWMEILTILTQTKQSSFWKGNLDLKNMPGSHSTKVQR